MATIGRDDACIGLIIELIEIAVVLVIDKGNIWLLN